MTQYVIKDMTGLLYIFEKLLIDEIKIMIAV